MVKISIQAAHEQVNPTDLLNDVILMDKNGIARCWSSDHYMPWWHTGASGAAAWPWMGAALAKTSKIEIGTGVTAPILRYNPAVVAQVFATLGFMFPDRVFLGVGLGESLNEVTTGNEWPSTQERFRRTKEAIPLYIAAMGSQTARLSGEKGDGFVTNEINIESIKNKLLPAVRDGAR